jgi:hypothetical protein
VIFGCGAISRFEAKDEERFGKTNPIGGGQGEVEKTKPICDRRFERVRI